MGVYVRELKFALNVAVAGKVLKFGPSDERIPRTPHILDTWERDVTIEATL